MSTCLGLGWTLLWLHWGAAAHSAAQEPPATAASQPLHAEAPAGTESEPEGAERAEYKRVVNQAIEEFDAERFAEARSLFMRAHELWPSARTLRTLGMTAFELRMYPRALVELAAALDDPRRSLPSKQRRQVASLLERTRAFVGRFRVRLSPDETELVVDGEPVTLAGGAALVLALGPHELRARAAGYAEQQRSLLVQGREDEELGWVLEPREPAMATKPQEPAVAAKTAPEGQAVGLADRGRADSTPSGVLRPLAWVAFGVAGAGLVVSAVFGGLALQRKHTVEDDDHCPDDACPPAYADELNQLKHFANASTAGAVIAAAGLGAGLSLWFSARRRSARAQRLEPRVGLGSLGLRGRF